eukprot:UC1_evm1s2032
MLIAWDRGQESCIHDHAGSHCFMKILDGSLVESLYEIPSSKTASPADDTPRQEEDVMLPFREVEACCNDIIYINDTIGLHRVGNPSHADTAVSLHVYSPPFQYCNVYCEESCTSRQSGKMTFYSEDGVLATQGS